MIRDTLNSINSRAKEDSYTPHEAAKDLSTLAAVLGNLNKEIRERELIYKRILNAELSKEGAATRAKLRAEITPEYMAYREATDLEKELTETVRSLRSFLQYMREERYYSGNQ